MAYTSRISSVKFLLKWYVGIISEESFVGILTETLRWPSLFCSLTQSRGLNSHAMAKVFRACELALCLQGGR